MSQRLSLLRDRFSLLVEIEIWLLRDALYDFLADKFFAFRFEREDDELDSNPLNHSPVAFLGEKELKIIIKTFASKGQKYSLKQATFDPFV